MGVSGCDADVLGWDTALIGDPPPEVQEMTPVDHRYVSGNECPHRHAVGENDGVGQEVAIFGFVAYKGAPAPAIGARRRDIDGASARPALQCVDHVCYPNAVLFANPVG